MSTFTRLYLVNRGPHLADYDSQDVPDGTGFVASETIPLDPARHRHDDDARLAILPQAPVAAQETLRRHSSPAIADDDAWARDCQDLVR